MEKLPNNLEEKIDQNSDETKEGVFEGENIWKRKDKSPERLSLALDALAKINFGKIEVIGAEQLNEIPPDRKVVIVTSHATDMDLPLAAGIVSKYFDIVITNQSLQYKFLTDPASNLGMKIAGQENFLPIDYKIMEGKKPRKFNPENYKPMAEAMEGGRSVIIAAHNPSHKGTLERGGYGAAYLSEISDAIIVPVGVNVKSPNIDRTAMAEHPLKTIIERPDVEIKIGKPFELTPIDGLDELAALIAKLKNKEKITKEDIERFDTLKNELKQRSGILIDKIGELMPEERKLVEKN